MWHWLTHANAVSHRFDDDLSFFLPAALDGVPADPFRACYASRHSGL